MGLGGKSGNTEHQDSGLIASVDCRHEVGSSPVLGEHCQTDNGSAAEVARPGSQPNSGVAAAAVQNACRDDSPHFAHDLKSRQHARAAATSRRKQVDVSVYDICRTQSCFQQVSVITFATFSCPACQVRRKKPRLDYKAHKRLPRFQKKKDPQDTEASIIMRSDKCSFSPYARGPSPLAKPVHKRLNESSMRIYEQKYNTGLALPPGNVNSTKCP